jgi:hypothetical protein
MNISITTNATSQTRKWADRFEKTTSTDNPPNQRAHPLTSPDQLPHKTQLSQQPTQRPTPDIHHLPAPSTCTNGSPLSPEPTPRTYTQSPRSTHTGLPAMQGGVRKYLGAPCIHSSTPSVPSVRPPVELSTVHAVSLCSTAPESRPPGTRRSPLDVETSHATPRQATRGCPRRLTRLPGALGLHPIPRRYWRHVSCVGLRCVVNGCVWPPEYAHAHVYADTRLAYACGAAALRAVSPGSVTLGRM